jgi:hydrogenase maturation protease
MEKILVMGVGNVLLSDEGVGVHTIEYMRDKPLPDYLNTLDGGTGGFHLLSLIDEYKKMILIDATIDDNPVGTLRVLQPRFSKDFPRALTTHDIGLKDLLDTASVLNKLPKIMLIVVTISPIQEIGLKLSPEIEALLPIIYQKVLETAEELRISVVPG